MTSIPQKQQAAQLLDLMKELVTALQTNVKPIAALREIFSELDNSAAVRAAVPRSEKQCFARA
jgi:hypothetical protein